ncbi:MAG: SDR family NAD(P)-dependent oxidoreductase, partial [Vicinamibacterales bacterium]|nr:SDR family NAD(P)-dependent oxidoreductase [Vicinamibacterales bacterium]
MSEAQKSALVTGGSKGIGRAIAAALLESGTHVLITGRDAASLAAAADALGQHGSRSGARVEWCAGDVRREEDARAMVEAAVERFGGL